MNTFNCFLFICSSTFDSVFWIKFAQSYTIFDQVFVNVRLNLSILQRADYYYCNYFDVLNYNFGEKKRVMRKKYTRTHTHHDTQTD